MTNQRHRTASWAENCDKNMYRAQDFVEIVMLVLSSSQTCATL